MGLGFFKGIKSVGSGGWKAVSNLGVHTKGVLVGTGLTYGGWKYMTTGNVPGQKTLETGAEVVGKSFEAASKTLDAANKGLDYVNKGLDKAPELIHDTKEALSGSVGSIGGSGGNSQGGGLFSGFSNLIGGLFGGGTGNILGLVAGAFMLFGGFGWMGKIIGALLSALSLGLLGNKQQQPIAQQVPVRQMSQQEALYPNMDMDGQIDGSHVIHRSR